MTGTPTRAELVEAARPVMTGAETPTVTTRVAVPVPAALVALKPTLAAPAARGVPEITPVAVFTVSPAGNGVALKLAGALVAVME